MTRDQYTKIGVSAHDAWDEDAKTNPTPVNPHAYVYGYKAGAQTILDSPQEWGLQDIEDSDERWCEVVDQFKQEADRYRRALERIASEVNPYIKSHENMWRIVFEALKQQDDE